VFKTKIFPDKEFNNLSLALQTHEVLFQMPTILVEQHSLKLDNFQNSEMVMKCQALKISSTNNPFSNTTVYQLSLVLYTAWKNEFPFLSIH